jgi:hypothetical protein
VLHAPRVVAWSHKALRSDIGCGQCGDADKETSRSGGKPDGGEVTIAQRCVVRAVVCSTGTLQSLA